MSDINIKKRLGWVKQSVDTRDFKFTALHAAPNTLPPRVDLRALCPPVYDQKNLGCCTGNGIAFAHEFAQMKQKQKAFTPSRLFIYYNERVIEGTINEDAGANIRDGFKSIGTDGVCSEKLWKYAIDKFTAKPTNRCYSVAAKHTAIEYRAVGQTENELKACIADGFPVVFGFEVFASFESDAVAKTGIVPMPQNGERSIGGHCVSAVGYDDDKQIFVCRNSWGSDWADNGYFYMPMPYVLNPKLSSDFWTLKLAK